MSVNFKDSETKINLMKAFAGESQAANRYMFAASQAKKEKLHVIEMIFKFTADQERAHAKIFYNHLKDFAGETIKADGGYPVDISNNISELLRYAQHNEFQESDDVYINFAEKAREEGLENVAFSFFEIAKIEKIHGDRFAKFAELLESRKLFVSDVKCKWMCLNCGNVIDGNEPPMVCPVCQHDRGYFVRIELAPYTGNNYGL